MGIGAAIGGAVISGGLGLLGSREQRRGQLASAQAALEAARIEDERLREAQRIQQEQFQQVFDEQQRQYNLGRQDIQPYQLAGQNALLTLQRITRPDPYGGDYGGGGENRYYPTGGVPPKISKAPSDLGGRVPNTPLDTGWSGGQYIGTEGSRFTGQPITRSDQSLQKMPPQPAYPTALPYSGFQASPGYQNRLLEGSRAIDRSAAAAGGALSGAALKAGIDYASNLADQEYGDWFNRALTLSNTAYGRQQEEETRRAQEYGDYWNRIAQIAGIGQSATSQGIGLGQSYASGLASASQNNASALGNILAQRGAAGAAGQLGYGAGMAGVGNANAGMYAGLNQAFQGGLQNYLLYQNLNQGGGYGNMP